MKVISTSLTSANIELMYDLMQTIDERDLGLSSSLLLLEKIQVSLESEDGKTILSYQIRYALDQAQILHVKGVSF